MEEFLKQLLTSLEKVEVRGKDNLDILLGCIVAIERAIEKFDSPAEEENNG